MRAGVVADTIPFHLFSILLGRFYENDFIFCFFFYFRILLLVFGL